ncbi:hypothetical protein KXD40_000231 [Peronospora effusa]|nr:hypothetical protein KXD40_000231 [Peronospora effusa]
MYFMQPRGSIIPYLILRLFDYGFGTAGVMSAAVADVVTPEKRAAAFGILFAGLSVGYCISAFIAPFFSRVSTCYSLQEEVILGVLIRNSSAQDHVLQIAAALFVSRVLWAMIILPETLPVRSHMKKTRWVMENPISAMSILFRNKLFMRLTCLIALTSFVASGTFQIQSFYLNVSRHRRTELHVHPTNTIVGFDVKDFGDVMLLGGVLSLLAQCLLLKPLVTCFKEKGVIVIAVIASFVTMVGFTGTAFYPHKWVVYALCVPGSLSDLSFPAIAALKSINVSEKEQGRLQGAIYGARSVFDALGPVIFSSLYAAMTQQSTKSQALPYFVAAFIYFVGIGVALSLPVGKPSSPRNIVAVPAPLPSQTCGDSPSTSAVYFDTDDDETDQGNMYASGANYNDDEKYLVEPLLGNTSNDRTCSC